MPDWLALLEEAQGKAPTNQKPPVVDWNALAGEAEKLKPLESSAGTAPKIDWNALANEEAQPQTEGSTSSKTTDWGDLANKALSAATYPQRKIYGDIFTVLGLMDNPRGAIANAAYNATNSKAKEGAWEGIKKGIKGEEKKDWIDVFGIDQPSSKDSWPEYLLRGGLKLGTNVVLDPLNLAFMPGLAAKSMKYGGKAAEALGMLPKESRAFRIADQVFKRMGFVPGTAHLAGGGKILDILNDSPLGLMFSHTSRNPRAERILKDLNRDNSLVPIMDKLNEADAKLQEAMKQADFVKHMKAQGLTPQQFIEDRLFPALERPGTSEWYGVPQEMLDIFKPLKRRSYTEFERLNERLAKMGMETKAPINEPGYDYMKRVPVGPKHYSDKGRVLYRWADNAGNTVEGRAKDVGVIETTDGWWLKDAVKIPKKQGQVLEKQLNLDFVNDPVYKGVDGNYYVGGFPMQRYQLTRPEAQSLTFDRQFVSDPLTALGLDITGKIGKNKFLSIMDEFEQAGLIQNVAKGRPTFQNYRSIRVPGMEQYVAPKGVANRLDNIGRAIYDPETAVGQFDKLFKAFMGTEIGNGWRQLNNTWKRNNLALIPGFHSANLANIPFMLYMADVKDPRRVADAGRVLASSATRALEGMANKDLLEAVRHVGGVDRGALMYLGDSLKGMHKAADTPYVKRMTDRLGKIGNPLISPRGQGNNELRKIGELLNKAGGKVGDRAYRFSEGWRRLNDWVFKQVARSEDLGRMAIIVDQLKKKVPKGAKPTPQQIDDAVAYVNEHIPSSGEATIMERNLQQVIPFISWHRHIIARTLKDVASQPQKLAHMGRFLNFALTPASPGQREVMPEWMKTKGPAQGFFGGQHTMSSGEPGMFLSSRFVPYGSIEEYTDWKGALPNLISPYIKSPIELLANKSFAFDKPIDDVVEGTGFAVADAMLKGEPHGLAYHKTLGQQLSSYGDYIVRNLNPLGRHVNTIDTLLRNGPIKEPGRPKMSVGEKGTWWATGGRAYPLDERKWKYRENRATMDTVEKLKAKIKYFNHIGDKPMARMYMDQLQRFMKKKREERRKNRVYVE